MRLGPVLLLEALRYIDSTSQHLGFPSVFLYATEEGVPLYEAHGFKRISPDKKAYFLSLGALRTIVTETA